MDADQLDLKITRHVVTPDRVLEDGWIGVRGEIVAGLGPAAPAAQQVIDARGQWEASMFETDPSRFPRIGMLFAPSRDGRSHCPEKWTEPDDIAVCLTAAVIRLDEELAPGPWP